MIANKSILVINLRQKVGQRKKKNAHYHSKIQLKICICFCSGVTSPCGRVGASNYCLRPLPTLA